jgi:hypothetical protein
LQQSMCFLNFVFTDGQNKIHELVKFVEDDPMSFELAYVNESELKKLYEEGNYKFDFSVKDGYLIWDGQEPLKVSSTDLEKYMTRNPHFKNSLLCVYDLLRDLIKVDGLFISSKTVPLLGEIVDAPDMPITGVGRFADLAISRSVMSVYLRVTSPDGWKTRNFISMKDGSLSFHKFHFAVNKEIASTISNMYPVNFVTDAMVEGRNVSVFVLEDGALPIYPMPEPYFKICEPMLNYKVYISERDKAAMDFINFFISNAIKANFPDQEAEEKDAEKVTTPYVPNEDSKLYVVFKLSGKQPSNVQKAEMLKSTLEMFQNIRTDSWSVTQVIDALRRRAYNDLQVYACLVVLKALTSTDTSVLDRIACARSLRNEIKVAKNKGDLELFMYRAYMYVSDHKFPYNTDNYFLNGGTVPYRTEIIKRVKGLG